jgi:hypothetical protein
LQGSSALVFPLLALLAAPLLCMPPASRSRARTADGRTWSGTAAVTPGGVAEVVLK